MSSKTAAIIRLATENGVNVDIVSGAHHRARPVDRAKTFTLRENTISASVAETMPLPSERRSILSIVSSRDSGTGLDRGDEVARREINVQPCRRLKNGGVVLDRDGPSLPPRMDGAAREAKSTGEPGDSNPVDHSLMSKLVLHDRNRTSFSYNPSTGFLDRPPYGKLVQSRSMAKLRSPDENLSPLASAVRQMRVDTGLSVRDFARAAGFGERFTSYSYYEGPVFTGEEIPKRPRIKIALGFLKLGIAPERVAQLGKLPNEFSQTKAELAALRRELAELRGEVAEIKAPTRRRQKPAS